MSLYLSTPGLADRLAPFVQAGALLAGEAHAIDRLGRLAGEADAEVLLGCAFALRAPRVGDAGVFLDRLPDEFTLEREEPVVFDWPTAEGGAWTARVRQSALVGPDSASVPFCLGDDGLLQTRRLALYEARLARALAARGGLFRPDAPGASALDLDRLRADLALAFPPGRAADLQRLAGVLAVLCRTTIITGGPGTGTTTTVARVLRLLHGQAEGAGERLPHVALAAPTGKAAARMREALVVAAAEQPGSAADWVAGLGAQTLHRLLGYNPSKPSRFRHDAKNPLGHDVVIVDEASMIDVAMMCKLVEAVSPSARLVLLGDRNQLASVEAGSVLADFAAAVGTRIRLPPDVAHAAALVLGSAPVAAHLDAEAPPIASGMVSYTEAFRFSEPRIGHPIYRLADASREPLREAEHLGAALEQLLGRGSEGETPTPDSPVFHVENPVTGLDGALLDRVTRAYAHIIAPLLQSPTGIEARTGALAALDTLRVLAAHRAGPHGVVALNRAISERLRGNAREPWWVGRAILVTENDYEHALWNGDVGLVTRAADRSWVAIFPAAGAPREVPVAALPAHESAFAMTIHKSQGSQFDHAVVVLPSKSTPLLTRELVYTGVSRARSRLTLACPAPVLETAVRTRVRRASGLAARLRAQS